MLQNLTEDKPQSPIPYEVQKKLDLIFTDLCQLNNRVSCLEWETGTGSGIQECIECIQREITDLSNCPGLSCTGTIVVEDLLPYAKTTEIESCYVSNTALESCSYTTMAAVDACSYATQCSVNSIADCLSCVRLDVDTLQCKSSGLCICVGCLDARVTALEQE